MADPLTLIRKHPVKLASKIAAAVAIAVAIGVPSASAAVTGGPPPSAPVTAFPPTPATVGAVPAIGVRTYNQLMCGSNEWVPVKLATSEYAIHDSAGTCVDAEKNNLDFAVTKITKQIAWQYPNIGSGYELGESSCASTRDTCYKYPVQVRNDGTPVASVKAWLAPGKYNLSFDAWFSRSSSDVSYQDRTGDTEVMIWLASPGINDSSHYEWHATIDGIRFGVMTWEAGQGSGHPWRYVAYVAPRTALGSLSVSGLWLNPIFRNVEAHGYLSSSEWLTAIDLGFELVSKGQGDNIHYYSLTDLPRQAVPAST
jgi:hypothetical protein